MSFMLNSDVYFLLLLLSNFIILFKLIITGFLPISRKERVNFILLQVTIALYSNSIIQAYSPFTGDEARYFFANSTFGTGILSIIAWSYFAARITNQLAKLKTFIHFLFLFLWSLMLLAIGSVKIIDGIYIDNHSFTVTYTFLKLPFVLLYVLYVLFFVFKIYLVGYNKNTDDNSRSMLIPIFSIQFITWIGILITNILLPSILGSSSNSIIAPFLLIFMNMVIIIVFLANRQFYKLYRFFFLPSSFDLKKLAVISNNSDITHLVRSITEIKGTGNSK